MLFVHVHSPSWRWTVADQILEVARPHSSFLSNFTRDSPGLGLAEAQKVATAAKTEVDRIAGEAEKQAKTVQQDVKKTAAASQKSAGSKKPAKK